MLVLNEEKKKHLKMNAWEGVPTQKGRGVGRNRRRRKKKKPNDRSAGKPATRAILRGV